MHVVALDLIPKDRVRYYASSTSHTVDPHFWLDPIAVRGLLPDLAERLSEIDPGNAQIYQANANAFAAELQRLDQGLSQSLVKARDMSVVQHHPSMNYFLARYGITSIGAIEASPGQEPTPRDLQRLAETMRAAGTGIILTEPQLPAAPVEALAEMTDAAIVSMDPLGGVSGRETYADLLRYNARALAEAVR
jgi:ABC-type Zn uptake system ZnuABC Zn-binding protein ZnuA